MEIGNLSKKFFMEIMSINSEYCIDQVNPEIIN